MRLRYILLNLLVVTSLQAQVNVSGDQYGTWGVEDSLYTVIGDITVPYSQFLTILPGVEVRFMGDYKITVLGGMTAWGTEEDSVIFHTYIPDGWMYIKYDESWGDSTSLNYCRIQSGDRAVWAENCAVTLNHCNIVGNLSSPIKGNDATLHLNDCLITQNAGNGLLLDNCTAELVDCEITYCGGTYGRGIFAQGDGTTLNIQGGFIGHNLGSGIYGLQIGNSIIENVAIGENGVHGIELNSSGELEAARVQLFRNEGHGLFLVNTTLDGRNLTVSSNNDRGISFTGPSNVMEVTSSIVDRNGSFGFYYQSGGAFILEYNDTYLNIGDAYSGCEAGTGSLEDNPEYVDWFGMDYNLQETSPCIDAGRPADPLDPDATITDMGALYFDQSPGYVPPGYTPEVVRDFHITGAYPNPFNPVLTIQVEAVRHAQGSLEAWTPAGKLADRIWKGELKPGQNLVTWHAGDLASGSYFIRLKSGSVIDVLPTVLLK
ncbi:hypothetical protein CEE37_03155 [candidate division LCP-89 bacterium B3_LCP]|uniref:Right handed beta helix domain-containing protein n=1 Tax=candidate division LCP-89 bacterium B3_LCP TaxID=2012998 RepID=A0A532V360_UNCL8|nr:MAG: hypothetical protein CEE37_03155 [candidate division LCP-89 bacterium B3_LCP]